MITIAPRIPSRLLDEIERLSRKRVPIAEINRRVGRAAWRMRLPKPSYEQVRVLVHTARRFRRAAPDPVASVALAVALRTRAPIALVDRLGEGRGLRLRDLASPQ